MDKNTLYAYINEIGNHLSEKNIYGAASLMIGAGFSKNAKSLKDDDSLPPNWQELAYDMYDELYPLKQDHKNRIEECSGKNILSLAQKYQVIFGRKKLNKLIENSVADEMYEPTQLYNDLLQLDWEDVYTTNYDTLLERALSKSNLKKEYKIIYSCKDLPKSTRPRLIKLHGSVDKSDDYIITEEDYRTYPKKYAPFVNTVQQSMLETKLCLIGFSGTDPNFLNWLGWLRDNMGENCPTIYLCGYFPNVEYADQKMLEQKNIVILNLSPLIEKDSINPHYDSIQKFIALLKNKTKEKEKPLFDSSVLKFKDVFDLNKIDLDSYIEELDDVTKDLEAKVNMYMCLPQSESKKIYDYCFVHLDKILHCDKTNQNYSIISRLSYVISKCFAPLTTIDFNNLKNILLDSNCDNFNKFRIGVSLLKQARILSDFKSYDFIIKILDKIKINNTKLCNEFTIAKIKRNMVDFKFKEALELIDKIDDSNDLYYMLIRANLYQVLGMKDLSKNQLKSASEFLNNSKLEDNKYASAIGYLRLVSISMFGNINQINSDQGWIENKFNTKTILNKYRENIIEVRYEEFNQASSSYSFNPNTTKHSYNMNFGISNKFKKCFGYLSLIDQLSLGIFSDHQQITIDIMNELESHSKSIYYGWYTILMSGNNKIVDQFFTRERVYDADIIEVNQMLDNIYEFIACGIGSIPNKKISILINFLSKLTAVVDVDKIKKLIRFLTQLEKHESEEVKKAIRESLETIKYSFNDEIFLDCLDLLINDVLAEYMFPVYFLDFRYQGEKKTEIKKAEISNFIVNKSNSCNVIERTNTVALCLIFINYLSNDSKQEIVNNLMEEKDGFGFPTETNFNLTVWEKGSLFETKDLYNYYLCNPKLTCIHHNGFYFENGGALEEITVYEHILINLLVNRLEEITLTQENLKDIIEYFNEYIRNEQACLNNDFLDMEEIVIRTIYHINSVVLLLVSYIHHINNIFIILIIIMI